MGGGIILGKDSSGSKGIILGILKGQGKSVVERKSQNKSVGDSRRWIVGNELQIEII